MLWDTHLHTSYSGDSSADPEDMVKRAMSLGLGGICVTDHLDLDFPAGDDFAPLNLGEYVRGIPALKEKYSGVFPVRFGVELGLMPHLAQIHADILAAHDFDFVIGSSHAVHGRDPYYPEFFEGQSEEESYMEYFWSIPENIRAFDGFDVYGHIDYIVRYGPNQNKYYSYEKYGDIIDEILRMLIERGKGIELNTAGFKYGLGHPNPTEDVIRRYRELGGEIITVGSDAHAPEQVGLKFTQATSILEECGFAYYTVFRDRKPEFIKL